MVGSSVKLVRQTDSEGWRNHWTDQTMKIHLKMTFTFTRTSCICTGNEKFEYSGSKVIKLS